VVISRAVLPGSSAGSSSPVVRSVRKRNAFCRFRARRDPRDPRNGKLPPPLAADAAGAGPGSRVRRARPHRPLRTGNAFLPPDPHLPLSLSRLVRSLVMHVATPLAVHGGSWQGRLQEGVSFLRRLIRRISPAPEGGRGPLTLLPDRLKIRFCSDGPRHLEMRAVVSSASRLLIICREFIHFDVPAPPALPCSEPFVVVWC
jgi:hypothetical protein